MFYSGDVFAALYESNKEWSISKKTATFVKANGMATDVPSLGCYIPPDFKRGS